MNRRPRSAARLHAVALVLTLLGAACSAVVPSGQPAPGSPTVQPPVVGGPATAVVRLSGREIELAGGTCTWFEGEGRLHVEIGPTAAGDRLRLIAPLAWADDNLPPGAGSAEGELTVSIGGSQVHVPASGLSGELATDLDSGSFVAGVVAGGMPLSGEFWCPEVIDGE